MPLRWRVAQWLDCTFLHPLHYVHPAISMWLTHYVCYPICRREVAAGEME